MNKDNKYTLLVNSCDSYQDCWEPFFKLLKKYWEFPPNIVLNTESKTFSFEGLNIKCINACNNVGKIIPWGNRLKYVLEQIHTKYVIIILDDYFIKSRVNTEQLNKLIEIMENNEIRHILLSDAPGPNYKYHCDGLLLRDQFAEYRLSLQIGIWEKDCLMKHIRNYESPWNTEIWGSKRAQIYNDKFMCIDKNFWFPINYVDSGGVIARGKWIKENIEYFIKNEQIKMDLSKRGFYKKINRTFKDRIKNRLLNLPTEIKSRLSVTKLRIFK